DPRVDTQRIRVERLDAERQAADEGAVAGLHHRSSRRVQRESDAGTGRWRIAARGRAVEPYAPIDLKASVNVPHIADGGAVDPIRGRDECRRSELHAADDGAGFVVNDERRLSHSAVETAHAAFTGDGHIMRAPREANQALP